MSKARVLLANSRAVDARECLHFVVGRPRPPAPPLEAWLLLGEAHEELGEGQQAMLAYGEAVHAAEEAGGESDAVLVSAARRRRGMLLESGAGANAQHTTRELKRMMYNECRDHYHQYLSPWPHDSDGGDTMALEAAA